MLTPFTWTTTRSALFREGAEAWEAASAYGPPLRAYLGSRYPRLAPDERDDLAQELLIEIRQHLSRTHDPDRGRFRQLLQVAIRSRVIDHFRRRAREAERSAPAAALEEVPAPTDTDVHAIDLEAALVDSLAAARDELTQGGDADHDALFALADRVIHGRSEGQIAEVEGVSRDAVARRLRRAREVIWRHVIRRMIGTAIDDASLAVAVEVVRAALHDPAHRERALERLSSPALRERLGDFVDGFRTAARALPSLATGDGAELRRSIEEVLAP